MDSRPSTGPSADIHYTACSLVKALRGVTGCYGSFSAGHVHESCWSERMQMGGQISAKLPITISIGCSRDIDLCWPNVLHAKRCWCSRRCAIHQLDGHRPMHSSVGTLSGTALGYTIFSQRIGPPASKVCENPRNLGSCAKSSTVLSNWTRASSTSPARR